MRRGMFRVLIAALFGAVIGAVGSWVYCRHLWAADFTQLILDQPRHEMAEAASTLTLLDRGDYSYLADIKKEALSSDLNALSFFPLPSDEKGLRPYKMAARYLEKHPYKSGDTNDDESVNAFLSKIRAAGAGSPALTNSPSRATEPRP